MFGSYQAGSLKDWIVESFAGTHDIMGGQMWGLYNELGNTTRGLITKENPHSDNPNRYDGTVSSVTAIATIPVAAPFCYIGFAIT